MTLVFNPFTGTLDYVGTGGVGPPGPAMRVETPAGDIDGVNETFTTSVAFVPGTTLLYLNGLAQSEPQDYNEMSATTVLFGVPPLPGDTLRVAYSEA